MRFYICTVQGRRNLNKDGMTQNKRMMAKRGVQLSARTTHHAPYHSPPPKHTQSCRQTGWHTQRDTVESLVVETVQGESKVMRAGVDGRVWWFMHHSEVGNCTAGLSDHTADTWRHLSHTGRHQQVRVGRVRWIDDIIAVAAESLVYLQPTHAIHSYLHTALVEDKVQNVRYKGESYSNVVDR